jgi:hypothetical protein
LGSLPGRRIHGVKSCHWRGEEERVPVLCPPLVRCLMDLVSGCRWPQIRSPMPGSTSSSPSAFASLRAQVRQPQIRLPVLKSAASPAAWENTTCTLLWMALLDGSTAPRMRTRLACSLGHRGVRHYRARASPMACRPHHAGFKLSLLRYRRGGGRPPVVCVVEERG